MELINKLVLRRNVHGWLEETEVSVYVTWLRGCQVFVVHPSHNSEEDIHKASRYGQYFLTHVGLIDYMARFKQSFATNTELDFGDVIEHDSESLQRALDHVQDVGGRWRIVIHENDVDSDVMARAGYVKVQAMRSYGVRIDRSGLVEAPFLCALKSAQGPTVFNAFSHAVIVATGLMAIGYESQWSQTIATMFKVPTIQIQRAIDDEWTNEVEYDFLSTKHKMIFNNDFTKTSIVTTE